MAELTNPPALEHGFVQGRFVSAVADTLDDEDRYPDLHGIKGSVRLTALSPIHLISAGTPATVVQQPEVLPLNDDGWLVDKHSEADSSRTPGVWLPVGRYQVQTIFPSATPVPQFSIEVTAEHTKESPLNLTLAAPIILPPRTTEVTRVIDRQLAEEAATAARASAEAAHEDRDSAGGHADAAQRASSEARTARDETVALGITVDTSAGTVVRLGGLLLSGDTGQRIVNEQLYEGWTAEDVIMLSRVNSTVTLLMYGLTRGEGASTRFMNLPAGFRPARRNVTMLATGTSAIGARRFEADLGMSGGSNRVGDAYNGVQVQWYTNDAWPNSLPGTPT